MGLGLYVHIPFCARRCSYCDFCTVEYNGDLVGQYHDLLKMEVEMYPFSERVETVYFGGGSPSLYPVEFLRDLLSFISYSFDTDLLEATIEANPWELNLENLKQWRDIGFNRLSIGIQSSEREILERCDRPVPRNLRDRLMASRDIFQNLNLDFILGLPGENESNVAGNLEMISEVNPDHVSYYVFDSDHETKLMRLVRNDMIDLPENEIVEGLHDIILDSLSKMGFCRYEISSWEKGNCECLHNLKYWRNEKYLGFGVSAGSHFDRKRYVNTSDLLEYRYLVNLKRRPVAEMMENSVIQEVFETLFMGLRLVEGVDLSKLKLPEELNNTLVSELRVHLSDYLSPDNARIRLNDNGMDLSRSVLEKLMEIKEEIEVAFST
ncbi:MAG: radical SAM family heme chaperone HemW [Kosmotogaceae bacterium]|nr:radical SAM family heme chaperone HemW [Kosmotogaceae bacterium]